MSIYAFSNDHQGDFRALYPKLIQWMPFKKATEDRTVNTQPSHHTDQHSSNLFFNVVNHHLTDASSNLCSRTGNIYDWSENKLTFFRDHYTINYTTNKITWVRTCCTQWLLYKHFQEKMSNNEINIMQSHFSRGSTYFCMTVLLIQGVNCFPFLCFPHRSPDDHHFLPYGLFDERVLYFTAVSRVLLVYISIDNGF